LTDDDGRDSHCFDLEKLDQDKLKPKTNLEEKNWKAFNDLLKNFEDIFAATVEQLQYCKKSLSKLKQHLKLQFFHLHTGIRQNFLKR
jgi:hypothetical protein